jgi:hypothetical protein
MPAFIINYIKKYLFGGNMYHLIFKHLNIITTILFILSLFGIYFINKQYLSLVNNLYHFYIASFLLIRFNPFRKDEKNEFDKEFNKELAFSAGLYLIVSSSFFAYIRHGVQNNVSIPF